MYFQKDLVLIMCKIIQLMLDVQNQILQWQYSQNVRPGAVLLGTNVLAPIPFPERNFQIVTSRLREEFREGKSNTLEFIMQEMILCL